MSVWQHPWQPSWQLPDHLADVLPFEARHIEELRRELLDTARGYGYELVMPPLLEHIESLLTGTGQELDLQTFKLVDQLSGRMMGLRADTTPQVARIDAHLLGRPSVTRLCYCGPVLHTKPDRPHATREPMQFGCEIYGHAGPEADAEVLHLALDCLQAAGAQQVTVDLSDVRVLSALLAGSPVGAGALSAIHDALANKDTAALRALAADLPAGLADTLQALLGLYGDESVLDRAAHVLPVSAELQSTLDGLRALARQLQGREGVTVSFDLAELRGYSYYRGARFAIYVKGASDALVRGGRYDGIGAAFHPRAAKRAAVGFSLDLKSLAEVVPARALRTAVCAPWAAPGDAPADAAADLQRVITALRGQGETVVRVEPGHEADILEFNCDRVLRLAGGHWVVQAL